MLCVVDKNHPHDKHPYYMIRCQRRQLGKSMGILMTKYPESTILGRCDDPNAIHTWCRFKEDTLGAANSYKKPLYPARR